jgi:diketogulonate reductase-like aldo/keto reductase
MTSVPAITLNQSVSIPQLGFGVWQMNNADVVRLVKTAFDAGYRSIDTAALYGNEEGVGRAIAESGVPRDEIFVTSKLDNASHGFDEARRAFDETCLRLNLDVIDLYLIHWPMPKLDRYIETWKALEGLRSEGRVRAIGVSNFQIPHLERLLDETGTVPAVNQIELHPTFQQNDLAAFHRTHGIATEAWSPLAKGAVNEPTIRTIAEKHRKSSAQVILRWHMQKENIAIPKTATPSRITENISIFDFELDNFDMMAIGSLDNGNRLGPHPDLR